MDRPQSILGLVTHLARLRWQALSPRGRYAAIGVAAMLGAAGAMGVHAMSTCCSEGGCAASSDCAASADCPSSGDCPMARRAHAEAMATQAEGETPPCHAGR